MTSFQTREIWKAHNWMQEGGTVEVVVRPVSIEGEEE